MLRANAWRRLVRPVDKRPFENKTIKDWVLGQPWPGLGFPDWATLYALLEKNIAHGPECMKLLQEAGAQSPKDAEREFSVKLGKARPLAGHGGDRRTGQVYNVNLKAGGGNRAEYLARRLAHDAPAIFKAFERKEYPSLRAACIEAGIVRVPSLLAVAQKAFDRLKPGDRAKFREWLRDRP